MDHEERKEVEPGVGTGAEVVPASKPSRPLSKLQRELKEEDLDSPGVKRLILAEIDRLEAALDEAKEFREKFYKADKEQAIAEERLKTNVSIDIIYGVCLSVGAAFLGLAPSFWKDQPYGMVALILGVFLMGGGVAAKWTQVIKR